MTAKPIDRAKHQKRDADGRQVARLKERRLRELDQAYSRHTRQLKHILQVLARERPRTDS